MWEYLDLRLIFLCMFKGMMMREPSPAESFWMHEFLPKDVGNVLFFNRDSEDNAFIIYVSRILWI